MIRYKYEKILTGPDSSFQTRDEVGAVIDCDFHVHPEYELTYIASSFGTRFIGDNISTFNAGDLALIGPMIPHHYYNSPNDSESPRWGHARVIQFQDRPGGIPIFQLPELSRIRNMLDDSRFGLDFPRETAQAAAPLVEELFSARDSGRLTGLISLLDFLSHSGYRKLSSIAGNASGVTPDSRINNVLRHIHQCLDNNQELSLDKAAARANMNPQAFSRYFRKTAMKCFIDYINEMKIGKACRMLTNSDHTVAEICFACGFSNLSNFNRQFKKYKLMSPGQFRAELRRLA